MQPKKFKITLGAVTLSLELGDADGNGVVDVTFGVRVVGMFEWRFPPINLDAKTAGEAVDAFKKLGEAFAKKK